jgi:glycosyltransferase involved in cell wall biosynthesis
VHAADFIRMTMKVVVMGNSKGFGGAQTAYRYLVKFMREEGYQVGAISITDGHDDELSYSHSLAFHRRVGVAFNVYKYWQTVRAAITARKFNPDVFIAVGLSRSADVVAAFLRSACFCVCQDFIFGRRCNDPSFLSWIRHFDALAVQAPSMVAPLRDQGFTGFLNWLPCFPVPPASGRSRVYRSEPAAIKIGYFGRLAQNKGLELLFAALGRVKTNLPIEISIWGGVGADRQRLERIVAGLKIGPTVQFFGAYPSGSEGAELMCSYDALVLPSVSSEGLPLILVEAMAYGIPVLATNVGAVRDCCIGNVDFILVEPTIEGLAAGVQALVSGLASNTFVTERLQTYYHQHFSTQVMAARWRSFLAAPATFFQQ